MEIKGIDLVHNIVEIKPSSEGGIFVTEMRHPGVGRAIGKRATVYIRFPRFDDFERMEEGDKDSLENYLQPDPDIPGCYKFAAWCTGKLINEHGQLFNCGISIFEYAPFSEVG